MEQLLDLQRCWRDTHTHPESGSKNYAMWWLAEDDASALAGLGLYHRFQNQSDLEYLAAAMLASLEVEQLAELFGSDDDNGRWRIFPQLATTAANLAAQSQEFFAWVLEHDPRVLMRMDFSTKSTSVKTSAINAILAATKAANATAVHDEHAHFSTLKNPRLAEQLKPWLCASILRMLVFSALISSLGAFTPTVTYMPAA